MKVVITGGTGFLGRILARRILQRGSLTGPTGTPEPVTDLVLLDLPRQARPAELGDPRVELVEGDVSDPGFVRSVLAGQSASVFHLAALLSDRCEADPRTAFKVNLGGTRAVLDASGSNAVPPRVVLASSLAVFGPGKANDDTKPAPVSTYGTLKAMAELLLNDESRRGAVDGRAARLPTVVFRPGPPGAGAWSWVSGIVRDSLAGLSVEVPVPREVGVPVCSYETAAENLVRLHEVPRDRLGAERGLNLPARTVTAGELIDEMKTFADSRRVALGPVTVRLMPEVMEVCDHWVQGVAYQRATALGLLDEQDVAAMIESFARAFDQPVS